MKVAVTYENGEVFQHFGRTEQFKLYQIEGGNVQSSEVVGVGNESHGGLINVLLAHHVEALICGGIGAGARNIIVSQGIKLYPGASGNADAAVRGFIDGNLDYDPDTQCNHNGEVHSCTCGH